MYAISLLGSIRRIERRAAELLEMRTYVPTETEPKLSETVGTLVDIAELLRAAAHFPLVQHTKETERAVAGLLWTRYRRLSAGPDDLDEKLLETARREAGVETGESWFVVPLGESEAGAKNWQPVFGVIRDRVHGIIEDFRRIGRRLRSSDSAWRLVDLCDYVVEMLDTLMYTLGRITATKGYVTYRTDQEQEELLEAIDRQTIAFRSDTDA